MLRDVLLRRPDLGRELLHARLADTEPVEQLDPRRLREQVEPPGDQLGEFVGDRAVERHLVDIYAGVGCALRTVSFPACSSQSPNPAIRTSNTPGITKNHVNSRNDGRLFTDW